MRLNDPSAGLFISVEEATYPDFRESALGLVILTFLVTIGKLDATTIAQHKGRRVWDLKEFISTVSGLW